MAKQKKEKNGNGLLAGAVVGAGLVKGWDLLRQRDRVRIQDALLKDATATNARLQALLKEQKCVNDVDKTEIRSLLAERDRVQELASLAQEARNTEEKNRVTEQEATVRGLVQAATEELSTCLREKQGEVDARDAELVSIRQELHGAKQQAKAQKDLLDAAEVAASEAKKMAGSQAAHVERLQGELAESKAVAEKVAVNHQADIESLQQELEVAKAEANKVAGNQQGVIDSLRQELEVARDEAIQLSSVRRELFVTRVELEALKGSHGGLEETKAQLEAEKLHLDKSLQRSTSSFKKAEDTIKAVRQEVTLKDEQLKKAQQAGKVVKLEGELSRTTAALEKVRGEAAILKKEAKEQQKQLAKKIEMLTKCKKDLQDENYFLRATKAPPAPFPSGASSKKSGGKKPKNSQKTKDEGKDEGAQVAETNPLMTTTNADGAAASGHTSVGGSDAEDHGHNDLAGDEPPVDNENTGVSEDQAVSAEGDFVVPPYEKRRLTRRLTKEDGWALPE